MDYISSLDITFLLIFIIFVTIGIIRGFIKEISALLVWVLSSVLAWFFAESVSTFFVSAIPETEVRMVISFIVIFAIAYIITSLAMYFLNKSMQSFALLRFSNKVLGAVVAAGKSVFIILLLVILAGFTGLPQKSWWKKSFSAPYFVTAAEWSKQYLPGTLAQHMRYR